jgi:hypothetical protein
VRGGLATLLRLAARCPTCGAAPPWRIPESERERYRDEEPGKRVATCTCPRILKGRRKCQTLYDILARDYQNAG